MRIGSRSGIGRAVAGPAVFATLLAVPLVFAPTLLPPLATSGQAQAQAAYPEKPVAFVVGFAAGGGMDTMARLVADAIAPNLGQPVVVENRPGAGGTLAPAFVAAAATDGYTLYAGETSAVLGPVFLTDVGYDPVASFAPIAQIAVAPHALVANPAVGVKTVQEFIDLLKAEPGTHFYSAPGTATLQFIAGEMLKDSAGIEMDAVQFQGGAPSVAAVVSGEVSFGMVSLSSAMSQAESGNLVILGHTGPERIDLFADIAPIAETLPGFEAMPAQYIMAPAGTDPAIVAQLSDAIGAAFETDGTLPERLAKAGLTPAYKPSDAVAAEFPAIAAELTKTATALRDKN